jgi:hypothetical protein
LSISGFGIQPDTLVPEQVPDLFAARPVVVLGQHSLGQTMTLQGQLATHDMQAWTATTTAIPTDNAALGVLWARERVTTLEDRLRLESGLNRAAIEKQIVQLAVEYQLLTRFTAFVLVDKAETIDRAAEARTVVQPVQAPAAWDMLDKSKAAGSPKLAKKSLGAGPPHQTRARSVLPGSAPMAVPQAMASPPPPPAAPAPLLSDALCASPLPTASPAPAGPGYGAFSAPAASYPPPPSAPFDEAPPAACRSWSAEPAPPPPVVAPLPSVPSHVVTAIEAFSRRWLEVRLHPMPIPADALQLLESLVLALQGQPSQRFAADGQRLLADLRNGVESVRDALGPWLEQIRSWAGLPALESWWSSNI